MASSCFRINQSILNLHFIIAFILSVHIQPSVQRNEDNLEADIQELAKAFPGCYSNAKQYYAHARWRFTHGQTRHSLLRAEFYKMEHPLFNDSLTIYFQHFTKPSSKPFSSGFYSFVADDQMKVIRMRLFKFKAAVMEIKTPFPNYVIPNDSINGAYLKHRSENPNLVSHSPCDMYWKKLSEHHFIGMTGSACLAQMGKDKVSLIFKLLCKSIVLCIKQNTCII